MAKETEKAIAKSLKKLLNEKPLNKVTISDIANDCGINRMTFYYHFKDIYNLVEWIFAQEFEQAVGEIALESWQDGACRGFEYMVENKNFILNVYHSMSRNQLETYLNQMIFPVLYKFINSIPEAAAVKEEDKKFIVNLHTVGLVAVMLQWVGQDMQPDWKPIVKKLSIMESGSFKECLVRVAASYAEEA